MSRQFIYHSLLLTFSLRHPHASRLRIGLRWRRRSQPDSLPSEGGRKQQPRLRRERWRSAQARLQQPGSDRSGRRRRVRRRKARGERRMLPDDRHGSARTSRNLGLHRTRGHPDRLQLRGNQRGTQARLCQQERARLRPRQGVPAGTSERPDGLRRVPSDLGPGRALSAVRALISCEDAAWR